MAANDKTTNADDSNLVAGFQCASDESAANIQPRKEKIDCCTYKKAGTRQFTTHQAHLVSFVLSVPKQMQLLY